MKKTNILFLMPILIILFSLLVSAECTDVLRSNSSDYTNFTTEEDKEISFDVDERFNAFTLFTPKDDFSHEVTENTVGTGVNGTSLIHWNMICDTYNSINSTFSIKNVSDVIDRSNYTLISSDNETFYVRWNDARYSGATVTVYFNRTFCADDDDIAITPELIQTDYDSIIYFADVTGGGSYGDSLLFRVEEDSRGGQGINVSDWTVSWTYYEAVCYDSDELCNSSGRAVLYLIALIFVMITIGICIWTYNQVMDGAEIKTIIIGGVLVIIGVSLIIVVFSMISNIC
jgi:hypothetical protein